MYSYGERSQTKLETCHSALIKMAHAGLIVSPVDITIIHGWRGQEVQDALFDSGASEKEWPFSKHNNMMSEGQNVTPESLAIDFGPWVDGKVPWKDTHMFALIAGIFIATFYQLQIEDEISSDVLLRWGGDWDMDGSTTDQKLMDWGHMELILLS